MYRSVTSALPQGCLPSTQSVHCEDVDRQTVHLSCNIAEHSIWNYINISQQRSTGIWSSWSLAKIASSMRWHPQRFFRSRDSKWDNCYNRSWSRALKMYLDVQFERGKTTLRPTKQRLIFASEASVLACRNCCWEVAYHIQSFRRISLELLCTDSTVTLLEYSARV